MRSPCPRKYWRRRDRGKQTARCHLNIHPLMVQQIHAGSSMVPSAPILPKNGLWSNHERMQEYADLARLRGGAAIPLALLTQLTGTTVANAGCIHQPQAPISLLPPLLEGERAACWTAQCSIGLKRKIVSRFPRRVAVVGGPYPEPGADKVGRVAACAFCSEMAGANSVMRTGVGSN